MDLLNRKENIDEGISAKFDRGNSFVIQRRHSNAGFFDYYIFNRGRDQNIVVPSFLFDQFRALIRKVFLTGIECLGQDPSGTAIEFKLVEYYRFRVNPENSHDLQIQQLIKFGESTDFLSFSLTSIESLDTLLYDYRVQHPNGLLDRIVAYHKQFQFTFEEGSESITSNLALRKDILSSVERYIPSLGRRVGNSTLKKKINSDANDFEKSKLSANDDLATGLFKSRLAEKEDTKDYSIDYEVLFAKRGASFQNKEPKSGDAEKSNSRKRNASWFPLPVSAGDIKSFQQVPFKCDFDPEEVREFREYFLGKREKEFFIGIEVMDAIFRAPGGSLRTFRFPLYYMKVEVKESGRTIFLEPLEGGRLYLNHLALANLNETFGKYVAGQEPVERFFKTLLSQKIEVNGRLSRIYHSRTLPLDLTIFDKTREVLIGEPGENGKGGILNGLNLLGLECDLESVYLYKSTKTSAPLAAALDKDLDDIQDIAYRNPARFFSSLLGSFLTPEAIVKKEVKKFSDMSWIPGSLPPATRRLINKLNTSDLMLLEGPPGTGKTYTIMNLFIQCLCSGKRLLVVSDQEAAIHALTEKLQEYLVGKSLDSPEAKMLGELWNSSVKVVDEAPKVNVTLQSWARDLKTMLHLDAPKDNVWPIDTDDIEQKIRDIDLKIEKQKKRISEEMQYRLGKNSDIRKRVAPKRLHSTTVHDIDDLIDFLKFMGNGAYDNGPESSERFAIRYMILTFIRDREFLNTAGSLELYDCFSIPNDIAKSTIDEISELQTMMTNLLKKMPKSYSSFYNIVSNQKRNSLTKYFGDMWKEKFPEDRNSVVKFFFFFWAFFNHPCKKKLLQVQTLLKNQKKLLKLGSAVKPGVWRQLKSIHEALKPGQRSEIPLSLEICRFTTESTFAMNRKEEEDHQKSIMERLKYVSDQFKKRDKLVKRQFVNRLSKIANSSIEKDENGGTDLLTTISTLIENLKTYNTIASSSLKDLQEKLVSTWPIWICRKQAVSFLFPTIEDSFDLVIVDEATQCRVDDALPLLFRANKLMVVGDEKQTVLAKNSVIDDYLFKEFNLDEHLRTTQARGIKGGGSHIFGLVKAIKQASVMLDEHYRCPPDIIEYSNRYVYGSELKTMQWLPIGKHASAIIDYSEANATSAHRRDSGKYKGLETEMIDRYLDFVHKTILEIEKETGQKINVETDVALCYFLLKNEPYIKDVKGAFLEKLGRGQDILDGAGAALQGKEREYIFYFWDISRANMLAFRQGDDPDKRKGELNVLMSRPKRRAYHYLHKNFRNLDHRKASITDYLWKAYNRQSVKTEQKEWTPRVNRPGPEFIPWRRSSGNLMGAILKQMNKSRKSLTKVDITKKFHDQNSVIVGDPRRRVDYMLVDAERSPELSKSIGIIDLCGFDGEAEDGQAIIDYFFQLKRAFPPIEPVFMFMHELCDENSKSYKILEEAISEQVKERKKKAS